MSLRRWRFVIAALILALFAALYLVPGFFTTDQRKGILSTQISTAFAHPGVELAVGITLLAATLLLGRFYCSVLCPAGLIQDVFSRLGSWLRIRRLHVARFQGRRWGLFIIALFAILVEVLLFVNFFDPIGLFGRSMLAAGEAGKRLGFGGGEYVYATAMWVTFALGGVFLVVLPLFRGRLFCDRLCPFGALMGLFSGIEGGARVRLDAGGCVSCGRCEKVCPTRCLDSKEKNIDQSRCVACLECTAACAAGAASYGRKRQSSAVVEGRREFLGRSAMAAYAGMFVAARWIPGIMAPGKATAGEPLEIVPPGARTLARHRRRCVTCQACVLACPVGIIRPNGKSGARPVLDYDYGYCQYNCIECALSCPAGVFADIAVEEKWRIRIAKTTLFLDRCIVKTQGTACGACAEVCPTHAVIMVEQGGGLPTIPDFVAEHCIGCGACYHVCPAEPRAFRLEGIAVHEVAQDIRAVGREERAESDATPTPGAEPGGGDGELQDFPF